MIKRYFLFLLLLLSVLGSVNASTIIIPDDYSTSSYVVGIQMYNSSEIYNIINGSNWYAYTPVITGIDDQMVYFESEKDMVRFSIPNDGRYPHLFDTSLMSVMSYDKMFYESRTSGSSTYSFTATKDGFVYFYGKASGGWNWDSGTVKLIKDGVTVTSLVAHYGQTHEYFDRVYVSEGSVLNVTLSVTDSYTTLDYILLCNNGDLDVTTGGPSSVLLDIYLYPVYIYSEPSTDVYTNEGELLGTTDNGGFLEVRLSSGEHTLKFVKEGYWDALETITVTADNNSELFVSLSPKTSIFQVSKEFSGNLYPNSVGTLSMDINPVKDAYASKLRVSGVEVNKVYYKTQELPKGSDGYYILGDVSSTQNIEIEFKTPPSWGEKTFTVELSATDIEGTAYTNLETINYEVLELPFLLEMPETFGIGINDITLTDQSGTAYSVLMVLYDSDDVEVWSSSTNLLEYCDYTFEVPIDDAGDYTLELNAKAGTVKTYYSVEIIEPVTLITDEITANPGKVATVQFKISNPTSSVKYYAAELTCPFFNESINKTFSIAPETVDKTVDLSFEVPEGLELENYQLTLEIFDPDKTDAIYSGNVVLTISTSSLFMASVPGGNTTLIILAAAVLLIAGTFAALRLKK
ncbi:hypothetical protein HNP88_000843 [Methanococcus maripaludis]|uniref:PEGA domain-containing protein n=1 Tax=Methanococcus maripaludis TaxID=39152 RepID=A0A7J9NNN7_METMI|nr:PEGA domain-containing protein [Methanococcus maripaludis]MBA2846659.1 hypothetical protein [Methanococcus maripaludis]